MLAGYLPFDDDPSNPDGDNINQLYKYILSTPLVFPEHVSALARDLLRRMLVPNPAKRANLEEIKAHEWLRPGQSYFRGPAFEEASATGNTGTSNGRDADAPQVVPGNTSKNTPAVPDLEAKQSKRHTIQVDYAALPAHITQGDHDIADEMPQEPAPTPEMVARARAAAQAALMGEKYEPQPTSGEPASGVSTASTKTQTLSDTEADDTDNAPAVPTSQPQVPAASNGDKYGSTRHTRRPSVQQRPRPTSMFASTDMQIDIPDELTMPPPISAVMKMAQGGLSSASSIEGGVSQKSGKSKSSKVRPVTMGPDQYGPSAHRDSGVSMVGQRSRSNSASPAHTSSRPGTSAGDSLHNGSHRGRSRIPEIPPILPINSTTGEELGIGIGAGIASHVPRHVEDVLFPDSPTTVQSPRPPTTNSRAAR
ncbi:hypothetical protein EC988_006995, partial [Linderina pennispora]